MNIKEILKECNNIIDKDRAKKEEQWNTMKKSYTELYELFGDTLVATDSEYQTLPVRFNVMMDNDEFLNKYATDIWLNSDSTYKLNNILYCMCDFDKEDGLDPSLVNIQMSYKKDSYTVSTGTCVVVKVSTWEHYKPIIIEKSKMLSDRSRENTIDKVQEIDRKLDRWKRKSNEIILQAIEKVLNQTIK